MAKKSDKKKANKKPAKPKAPKAPKTPDEPKAPKLKHPEAAEAVREQIKLSIKVDVYSSSMVNKLALDHKLNQSQARDTIAAVAEPILAQLEAQQ